MIGEVDNGSTVGCLKASLRDLTADSKTAKQFYKELFS